MTTKFHNCNLCGLSCGLESIKHEAREEGGLIDAVAIGHYDSTPGNGAGALDDLVRHRFSLCEWCLDWLFGQFKIPVAVDDPMNDYLLQEGETKEEALEKRGLIQLVERPQPEPWRPARERVLKDAWRTSKEEFVAEAHRRDAARGTLGPNICNCTWCRRK